MHLLRHLRRAGAWAASGVGGEGGTFLTKRGQHTATTREVAVGEIAYTWSNHIGQMAFVKLVSSDGAPIGSWAKVELHAVNDVADFAKRACLEFPFSQVSQTLLSARAWSFPSASDCVGGLPLPRGAPR